MCSVLPLKCWLDFNCGNCNTFPLDSLKINIAEARSRISISIYETLMNDIRITTYSFSVTDLGRSKLPDFLRSVTVSGLQ